MASKFIKIGKEIINSDMVSYARWAKEGEKRLVVNIVDLPGPAIFTGEAAEKLWTELQNRSTNLDDDADLSWMKNA